ncbi:StAR-related_transfer domain-containing protein [Hexamita inflata]|uniref:StAR-related transfer domain-containing protein n=1 Tax=Hexamita inflata TaxID=28002 RepID=A0AA86PM66_9EUKA|nr:StAR-related transfer domain-containing protein [Hexamita inflata]
MISSQVWEKLLLQKEETVQKVEDIVKQTVFEADKTLKTGVVCAIGTIAGQKFKAIRGSLVIKGDINKAIQYDLKEACITSSMSKKERHGLRQQQSYCPDSETTEYCKKLVKEILPFKPLVQIVHQVNESGVPLIKDREFVVYRVAKEIDGYYIVHSQSVQIDTDFAVKGVIRGSVWNFNKYTRISDTEFKIETYFCCDPAGDVPMSLFNMTLQEQMDDLMRLKEWCE